MRTKPKKYYVCTTVMLVASSLNGRFLTSFNVNAVDCFVSWLLQLQNPNGIFTTILQCLKSGFLKQILAEKLFLRTKEIKINTLQCICEASVLCKKINPNLRQQFYQRLFLRTRTTATLYQEKIFWHRAQGAPKSVKTDVTRFSNRDTR